MRTTATAHAGPNERGLTPFGSRLVPVPQTRCAAGAGWCRAARQPGAERDSLGAAVTVTLSDEDGVVGVPVYRWDRSVRPNHICPTQA